MTKPRKKNSHLLFNLINLYLVISTILVTIFTLNFGTVAGQVDTGSTDGWFYIITFTVQSNIFLGITALIALFSILRSKNKPLKNYLAPLYLMAATLTMLTCLVVVFYLAPLRTTVGRNYFDMLLGPMFFFHFFNPVLAALTLIFLTKTKQKLTLKSRLTTIIPLAVYGIFYFTGVILNLFPDFYQLTFGGQYQFIPLSTLVLATITFLISSALAYCRNRYFKLK